MEENVCISDLRGKRLPWTVLTDAYLGWEEISMCLEKSMVFREKPATQRPPPHTCTANTFFFFLLRQGRFSVAQHSLDLLDPSFSTFCALELQMCATMPVYATLGINPRALYVLGKHSIGQLL